MDKPDIGSEPLELDSLACIDEAIATMMHAISTGILQLPPRLALSATVILRALKVYRIVVGVDEDSKNVQQEEGDD